MFASSHNQTNPYDGGLDSVPGVDLTIQRIFDIVVGLTCWLTRFALLAMVIMLVIYGLQFITARGEPSKFNNAKKSFNYALVGILVIMATYTIIATIGNAVDPTANWDLFIPLTCSE